MLTAALTLAAVALALYGVGLLPDGSTRVAGAAASAAAVAMAVVAFTRSRSLRADVDPVLRTDDAPIAPSAGRRRAGLVLLALGGGTAAWALVAIWRQPFAWSQALQWMTGLLVMVVGAWLLGRYGSSSLDAPDGGGEPGLPRWLETVLVAGIVALAAWFRIHHISDLPPGIFIDETNSALEALQILEGRRFSPFATGWFETPNGFVYLQTLVFRLLGTTFLAIKVQSLVPGVLTVLALYLLARELFGTRAALVAATFLAVNRWHVNMSRWGWNEVYPPLIQIVSVLFILRGARRGHHGDWAVAGFVLGVGMYTYLAVRLVVLAIALYLGFRAVIERRFVRRHWRGLVVFVVLYSLTFAPLAFTYIKRPFTLLNRSQQVSILHDIEAAGGSLRPLAESVRRHVVMFHVVGDHNARHNLPGEPMLDPVVGAFFLLGLGWAVWRWRDHRSGLLLIWVPLTLLGGILTRLDQAPQAYRTLTVVPAVVLLAASAYDWGLRGLSAPMRRTARPWVWAPLAVAGVVAAGWSSAATYFGRQARDISVYMAFSPLENAVTHEVLARRADHRLFLSPRLFLFSPVRFFTYQPSRPVGITLGRWRYSPFEELGGGLDRPGYRLTNPGLDLPLPDRGGQSATFLLDTHFEHVMDLFRFFYPGVRAEFVRNRMGQPFYLSVTVPGPEIAALQGRNRAADADELRGLYLPATDMYRISAAGSARVLLDQAEIGPEPVVLGQGLHALRVLDLAPGLPAAEPVLFWEGEQGSGPVPDAWLFRVGPSGHGLLGTYYRGSDWAPPPMMRRIDPLIVFSWPTREPYKLPFSVTWTGELLAPADGEYAFRLHADDGVRLWLDGEVVGTSLTPDSYNEISPRVRLSEGAHGVRIDYFQNAGGKVLELFWQPPGEPMQPVAPRFLRPPS
jgi:4-amino-4-deoxy-L-arabinose transferase-like glycosyltransferase